MGQPGLSIKGWFRISSSCFWTPWRKFVASLMVCRICGKEIWGFAKNAKEAMHHELFEHPEEEGSVWEKVKG